MNPFLYFLHGFSFVFHFNIHYGNTGCGVLKRGGTKLERFLPKNQNTQRKFLNFENWTKSRKNIYWCFFNSFCATDLNLGTKNNGRMKKINFKNFDFCKLLSPILKIQKFPLGMLVLRQKSFYSGLHNSSPFADFSS